RTRKPAMIAETRTTKALRNVVFALTLTLTGATSMTNSSVAQAQTSSPTTTGVMVILTVKAGVAREQVMAVMPAEIRATVQLYLSGRIREWYSRRWSRSCLLAGCEGCRRGARDHGRPSAGQGKFHGSRVHCGRSTLAAPLAHGQSLSWTKSVRLTWSTVHDHRSVSAAMVPSRAAWRSLLWSAPLTA